MLSEFHCLNLKLCIKQYNKIDLLHLNTTLSKVHGMCHYAECRDAECSGGNTDASVSCHDFTEKVYSIGPGTQCYKLLRS
jgi:hypothetical protein